MADTEETTPRKKGGKGLIFGLVGALVLGGAGGYAAYSGLLPVPGMTAHAPEEHHTEGGTVDESAQYIPLDQITVPIGRGGRAGTLRLTLTVETRASYAEVIEERKPRILDTLNGFLRAVEEDDLREPANMERLRAQMLRRVMLEAPPGAVSDLLVAEFLII